jgi:hypothetical protein
MPSWSALTEQTAVGGKSIMAGQYDSSFPVQVQPDDFSCSIYSTAWVVQSIGVDVPPETMRGFMQGPLVSPDLGLLDGSGSGIANLLRTQWGLSASNRGVSFDDVAARAGQQPIALGGHNWSNGVGHWVGVRSFDGTSLILANPGGTGPRFGQQSLDRAAWNARAPFSAVFVDASGVADVEPSPAPAPVDQSSFVSAGRFQVNGTGGSGLRIRNQPSQSADQIGSLPEGSTIDGAEFAWRQVSAGGVSGWVADKFLQGSGTQYQVSGTGGSGVRIRSQPTVASDQVGSVGEGGSVSGAEFAFRQIQAGGGTVGWAADAFLTRVG